MDEKENNSKESAEELEAEEKNLAEPQEDDLRKEIISEFGFDEEDDAEKIEKAVKREMTHRKSLSSAIGQKRKYREELQKHTTPEGSDGTSPKKEKKAEKENIDEETLNKALDERLEKRDLAAMEYPDEIKNIISQVAKYNESSVKEAVKDPYVQSKIDKWKEEQEGDEAAISRTNKTGGKKTGSSDDLTPPDVDLDTEEGRKEYDKWKKDMVKKGY